MTDREAISVWNLAHRMKLHVERGQAVQIGKGSNGQGDGKAATDWYASIRKMIPDDKEVFILDYVYGDFGYPVTRQQMNNQRTVGILKRFSMSLRLKPELTAEYQRMYSDFVGD